MARGPSSASMPSAPSFLPPPVVTPYSQLGVPQERRPWWAPAGWLLVLVSSLVFYAVVLLLSPVILVAILARRIWARRLRYRRNPAGLRIAVVGAGWSGLQCLERFKRLGVQQVDVFERYDDIGGTWSPRLRYHGLQIHGSMTVTSFDGFPYSDDRDVQGGKVMAEEVDRYIHSFAAERDLLPHVRLHSEVEEVDYRSEDRTATLRVRDSRTGEQRTTEPYDLVIWASMAAFGSVPTLAGAERFEGLQLHTTEFSSARLEEIVATGRRVVVVGGGKAACDVVLGLRRAGYDNFEWVMRKPYLFYKFEALLHDAKPLDRLRGLSYLATVLWLGVSKRLGAVLHWSSGHLYTFGRPHTDFTRFHGGVLCATQRNEIAAVPYTIGDPSGFSRTSMLLADGREVPADVVIWATGNTSGIDTLRLTKDDRPFTLSPHAKLYNHFIVPELPVLASSTALWTTFGPMRATNSADLAVHHLCVRGERSEQQMARAAKRQLSRNSILHSFIWAHGECWLQQWVYFHIDLILQGITPIDAFLKHAIEVFVLAKETPLAFDILPRGRAATDGAAGSPGPAQAGISRA